MMDMKYNRFKLLSQMHPSKVKTIFCIVTFDLKIFTFSDVLMSYNPIRILVMYSSIISSMTQMAYCWGANGICIIKKKLHVTQNVNNSIFGSIGAVSHIEAIFVSSKSEIRLFFFITFTI